MSLVHKVLNVYYNLGGETSGISQLRLGRICGMASKPFNLDLTDEKIAELLTEKGGKQDQLDNNRMGLIIEQRSFYL